MAEWVYNASAGSDGDGSEASPFNAWSSVTSALGNGDTVLASGTSREGHSLSGVEDVRVLPGPGGPLNLYGDVALSGGGSWVQHGSHANLYRYNGDEAPSSKPIRVLEDWSAPTQTDGSDIPEADLEWQSDNDLSTAQSTAGSAVWETSSGYLWIHPSDSGTPASNGKAYRWTQEGNAFTISGCDRCTVVVGDIRLYSEYAGSAGYGLRILNSRDCTMIADSIVESGWHAAGSVGSDNQRNTVLVYEIWGRHVVTDNSGGYLVAASTSPNDGEAASRGNRLQLSRLYHYRTRLHDGTSTSALGGSSVFQCHGDGVSSGSIGDVECGPVGRWSERKWGTTLDRFEVVDLDDDNLGLVGASDIEAPASPTSWRSFQVRVQDGRIQSMRPDAGDSIGIRRVEFDITGGTAIASIQNISGKLLFESCDVVFDGDAQNNSKFVRLDNGADVYFINSAIFAIGTTANGRSMLASMNHTGGTLHLWSSIYARQATGWMTRDDASGNIVAANFDVQNCVFYNVDSSRYCSSATTGGGTGARSETDWQANIAPTATNVYGTDPEFEDPTNGDLSPAAGGWLDRASHTERRIEVQREGIDRQAWSGRYGAHQRRAVVRANGASGGSRSITPGSQ